MSNSKHATLISNGPTRIRLSKIAQLRNNPLLIRCSEEYPAQIGDIVFAKEPGSPYWPSSIIRTPSKDPDEEESVEETDNSKYALVMYFEPKFRLGMIPWSKVIPIHVNNLSEQWQLLAQLNKYECAKEARNFSKQLEAGFEIMKEFIDIEPNQRQEKMVQKCNQLKNQMKKKNDGSIQRGNKRKSSSSVDSPIKRPAFETVPEKTVERSKAKYSLRRKIVAPTKWNYNEMIKQSKISGEGSSPGSNSTRQSKEISEIITEEDLKTQIREKFNSLEKSFDFNTQKNIICSTCNKEINGDEKSLTHCHSTPHHTSCLTKLQTSKTSEGKIAEAAICSNCFEKRCAVCKENGIPDKMIVKCSRCSLHFHRHCLIVQWPQAEVCGSDGDIICPLHFCHCCKFEHIRQGIRRDYRIQGSKKLRTCIHCLATYHKHCIPAGSGSTIMSKKYFICPRHEPENSNTKAKKLLGCFECHKKLKKNDDVTTCNVCPISFHSSCLLSQLNGQFAPEIKLDKFKERFQCEQCLYGSFPTYGQVVWYKQPGFGYWPAYISYPSGEKERTKANPGLFCVIYFASSINMRCFDQASLRFCVPFEVGKNAVDSKIMGIKTPERLAQAAREAQIFISLSELERSSVLPSPQPVFRYITRNLYRINVTEVKKRWNKSNGKRIVGKYTKRDESDIVRCVCLPSDVNPCGPDSSCDNREAREECSDKTCKVGDKCQNRMFLRKLGQEDTRFEAFSSSTKAWGLRSKVELSPGDFVCEYVGEIVDKDEVNWRTERHTSDEPLYILYIDSNTYIDAEYYGNNARLINHSCDPNCFVMRYTSQGKPVVGIFAKNPITIDEELTFDYNYGSKNTFTFTCACKSSNCSGLIGVKPKGSKSTSSFIGDEENVEPKRKKKSEEKALDSDNWEEACDFCKRGGQLLLCEFPNCTKVYHCVCAKLVTMPKGKFICPKHIISVNSSVEVVHSTEGKETEPLDENQRFVQNVSNPIKQTLKKSGRLTYLI